MQLLKSEIKKLTEKNCLLETNIDEARKEKLLIQVHHVFFFSLSISLASLQGLLVCLFIIIIPMETLSSHCNHWYIGISLVYVRFPHQTPPAFYSRINSQMHCQNCRHSESNDTCDHNYIDDAVISCGKFFSMNESAGSKKRKFIWIIRNGSWTKSKNAIENILFCVLKW